MIKNEKARPQNVRAGNNWREEWLEGLRLGFRPLEPGGALLNRFKLLVPFGHCFEDSVQSFSVLRHHSFAGPHAHPGFRACRQPPHPASLLETGADLSERGR
jgi:hypothetical protein